MRDIERTSPASRLRDSQQNLGIRYATVRRQGTVDRFDAVGTTQFDESRSDVVQSRVTGYIDRLYANAPMQRIAKGTPVASLFVPEWLAPQEEYLTLKRTSDSRWVRRGPTWRSRPLTWR